jgi:pimeloyl-ACP methyl ester carboxylesterase
MRYRFASVELDTDTFELRSGDRRVGVEPQVFDVLAHLLAHRDRVVPKEELIDAVWGDRFVSESALTTRIKQARQAVGDDGQSQRVIKTVHGRGYRFVAPVAELTAEASPTDDEAPASLDPVPETHYVVNDGAAIAYQVYGRGPNLVLIEGYTTNVEVQWEHPAIAGFLRRLGSFCRVAVFDKRGTGLSERLGRDEVPTLDQRADDVRAVMDAAGMPRATVFGSSEGGSLSVLFTAAHPERVEGLVLHGTFARHPWLGDPDRDEFAWVGRQWGTGWVFSRLAHSMARTPAGLRFLGRFERQAATPGTARRLAEIMSAIDVTPVLASIHVPTLVIHRTKDPVFGISHAQDLTAGIAGARLVELPGGDHFMFSGDTAPILAAVKDFVLGQTGTSAASTDRFLATVAAVEVVGASDGFDIAARRCVAAHRGDVVEARADGMVAIFDGPGRGVRAMCDLRATLAPLGIEIRAAVHTAEVERQGRRVVGLGIQVANRLAQNAELGSIWVSRTVVDLVAGWGLAFTPRGEQSIDGLPHPLPVYDVAL